MLFDHRGGTIREPLGPPPALNILCIRLPGAVDTVAFNRRLPTRLPEHALSAWRDAFRLCAEGIAHGDPGKIGAAATASAAAAHRLGCPPAPPGLEACARETTALGILRAHSGTVWGLLYPEDETPAPEEVSGILNHGGRCHGARAARAFARDGRVPAADRRRLPSCPALGCAAILAD